TTKVTRNYQITIPADIRARINVERGDVLVMEYREEEGVIKIRVPRKGKRKTKKLGNPLGLEDVERSIERGLNDCLRS
ncbi:MAG: AbrB/MazE/SpoVT family DNA-binding domain-containing protein, partial [Thermoproteota archaeon]|nr:AbrB/MazE/SpoVT family DNA-binding domain-containing protein [Thermoproteota archaeon]